MAVYRLDGPDGSALEDRMICSPEEIGKFEIEGRRAVLLQDTGKSDTEALDDLRRQRDRLLAASDWIEFCATLPADRRLDWRCYRQQLRDLPQTVETPHDPDWPVLRAGRPQTVVAIDAWRRVASAHRRAFLRALTLYPAPDTGTAPPDQTLAELLTTLMPAQEAVLRALEDITVFQRRHSDMSAFAAATGLDDMAMDALFALAIGIEAERVSDAEEADDFLTLWTEAGPT
ncbi:phage tail assembly chaperone [Aestuariibius insulae]|uniref:phage tail assembly chaperone n=1 Tax=Aestuariibius insulae TaxID=2058287 RepID=UPI00345E11EC